MSDLLARLIEAGTPAELVGEVAMLLAEQKVLEKRRANERERKAKQRAEEAVTGECHVTSRDSTGQCVTSQDQPLPSPSPSFPPDPQTNPTPAHPRNNKPRARKADDFELPERIPAEPWSEFLAMRKRIGKPMTDHAKQLAVNKLDELAAAGWPPGDVLNNSILNSYQGLFPPKDQRNGSSPRPAQQSPDGRTMGRTEAAAREALARLAGSRGFSPSGQALPSPDGRNHGGPVALPDPDRSVRHVAGRSA